MSVIHTRRVILEQVDARAQVDADGYRQMSANGYVFGGTRE